MNRQRDRHTFDDLVDRYGDVITAADARRCGAGRDLLLRLEDRGEVRRIAKSAFILTDTDDAAGPYDRLRLRAIGFALCGPADAHVTGPAAAAMLGLPTIGNAPPVPTVIRPGDPHTGHTATRYGRSRHGHLPLPRRTSRGRVPVVDAAFCAVDAARHRGSVEGLVHADAALGAGARRESMLELVQKMTSYPGISTAAWVVEHADGRAESPLESLGRHVFLAAGRAAPISNPWIRAGERWFRVDHLLPDAGVIIEADGALKYNDRVDAGVLVAADRERERLLRGLGLGMVRYTWATAIHFPDRLLRQTDDAASSVSVRPLFNGWTLAPPWAA